MSETQLSATLYYDGKCPLCKREMDKLAEQKSADLCLLDIHQVGPEEGIPDRDTLLRDLHLRLADGSWLTGVDANVRAWSYVDRGPWLAWLRWPLVRVLADLAYTVWARWRYRRLYGRGGEGSNCMR